MIYDELVIVINHALLTCCISVKCTADTKTALRSCIYSYVSVYLFAYALFSVDTFQVSSCGEL